MERTAGDRLPPRLPAAPGSDVHRSPGRRVRIPDRLALGRRRTGRVHHPGPGAQVRDDRPGGGRPHRHATRLQPGRLDRRPDGPHGDHRRRRQRPAVPGVPHRGVDRRTPLHDSHAIPDPVPHHPRGGTPRRRSRAPARTNGDPQPRDPEGLRHRGDELVRFPKPPTGSGSRHRSDPLHRQPRRRVDPGSNPGATRSARLQGLDLPGQPTEDHRPVSVRGPLHHHRPRRDSLRRRSHARRAAAHRLRGPGPGSVADPALRSGGCCRPTAT